MSTVAPEKPAAKATPHPLQELAEKLLQRYWKSAQLQKQSPEKHLKNHQAISSLAKERHISEKEVKLAIVNRILEEAITFLGLHSGKIPDEEIVNDWFATKLSKICVISICNAGINKTMIPMVHNDEVDNLKLKDNSAELRKDGKTFAQLAEEHRTTVAIISAILQAVKEQEDEKALEERRVPVDLTIGVPRKPGYMVTSAGQVLIKAEIERRKQDHANRGINPAEVIAGINEKLDNAKSILFFVLVAWHMPKEEQKKLFTGEIVQYSHPAVTDEVLKITPTTELQRNFLGINGQASVTAEMLEPAFEWIRMQIRTRYLHKALGESKPSNIPIPYDEEKMNAAIPSFEELKAFQKELINLALEKSWAAERVKKEKPGRNE